MQIQSAEGYFYSNWITKYIVAAVESKLEYKIFKLKSPRPLNTLASISHKNHAVIKTVYTGNNKWLETVRQTWDNEFVGPHALEEGYKIQSQYILNVC